eukprot:TRINITY_DN60_c0_g2_i1.p1 TRINITY_DN60_c0_g2~~TRINITY_DN60_c0_g2_i1.p1  ORF type:complete len:713 (-),score=227.54 TRINITY_DN60_c0_g2_i1:99-2165(-)
MARLAAVAALTVGVTSVKGLSLDLSDDDHRPVQKVVKLLEGMQATIEKEAAADEKANNQMECWCSKNKEDMNKQTEDATNTIDTGKATIEENTAKSERLTGDIQDLRKEVANNKNTLDTAHALRKDQREKTGKDISSLQDSIDAVSKAEVAIGGSFAQTGGSQLLQTQTQVQTVAARLKRVADANKDLISRISDRASLMELGDFIKDPQQFLELRRGRKGDAFLQSGGGGDSSSAIDGLLQDMKRDFMEDLKKEQEGDNTNEKHYQELVTAKNEEVKAGEQQIEAKTKIKARAVKAAADAREEVMGAQDSLADGQTYLKTVTEKCAVAAEEYQARFKVRTEEAQAVGKTIEILDSDDAHALSTRSLSFIQTSSSVSDERVAKVSQVLTKAGKSLDAVKLLSLGLNAKKKGLDKVKAAMDQMTAALKQEAKDEIKKRDICTKELNTNTLETEEANRVKTALTGTIGELREVIDTTAKEMEEAKDSIATLEQDKKQAADNRAQESKEFRSFVQDQKDTQVLLKKAIGALGAFYKKPSLAQVREHNALADEDVPVQKEYKTNGGGSGVLTMMQQIVEDSAHMEKEAKTAEANAIQTWEVETKELEASIKNKQVDLANKASKKANLEIQASQNQQSKQGTLDDLDQLSQASFALHQDCDFTLKNFEVRQKARKEELEALAEAKAIIGGAKFD